MYGKINRYTKIFDDWEFEEVLGKGTSGIVYKVSKNGDGLQNEAAVKAITIYEYPGKKEKLSESYREGIEKKIQARRKEALEEVKLMLKLRGNTNIVDFYDYKICPWNEPNSFGVDLLLHIELLHNIVRDVEMDRKFTEQEIIHLGKDICNALRLCHSKNIMHRDIKPENIYRNDDGNYKLGDFGISRIIDMAKGSNMTVGLGTRPYMAPEQDGQDNYDFRVDIYSLGLVLYELANNNRLPFAKEVHDIKDAEIMERMRGKAFPAPAQASGALARVIMKACAHRPEERFHSAEEFWDALDELDKRGTDRRNAAADQVNRVQKQKNVDLYATSRADVEEKATEDIYATSRADTPEQYGYQETASDIPQETQVAAHMRELMERAKQGDLVSQYNLAWCYDVGDGIEKNPTEAAKWYRMSAEQGYALAQYSIGCCYMNAYGVAYNAEEAANWYLKSARQGNADAQNRIGLCYDGGNGVEQNYNEAIKWYRRAAEQGHASAQHNLGVSYMNGQGVRTDAVEAVKWYRKAAEQGIADAQNRLGVCYADGNGVERNYAEAIKWYRKAAEQGHASAQYNLAFCYMSGQGVQTDAVEAVKWYRRAAEQGDADAQNRLGVCYHDGVGVVQDFAEAIKWYRKAVEQDHAAAQYNLGTCYWSGLGVQADAMEAVKWYRRAAEQGHAEGQNMLGVCYHDGIGVEVNSQEAIKWYRRAVEQESAWAHRNIGKCYETGFGVEQNIQEALKWYQKAIELGNTDAAQLLEQIQ